AYEHTRLLADQILSLRGAEWYAVRLDARRDRNGTGREARHRVRQNPVEQHGRTDARDRLMAAQPGEAVHVVALQVRLAHGDPSGGVGRTAQAYRVGEVHRAHGRAAEVEK